MVSSQQSIIKNQYTVIQSAASVLPGRRSGSRAGFWRDSSRDSFKICPPAGLRLAKGLILPGNQLARKHYCLTLDEFVYCLTSGVPDLRATGAQISACALDVGDFRLDLEEAAREMLHVRLGDNYCNGSGRAFGAATLVNHFRNIMFFGVNGFLIVTGLLSAFGHSHDQSYHIDLVLA